MDLCASASAAHMREPDPKTISEMKEYGTVYFFFEVTLFVNDTVHFAENTKDKI